MREVERIVVFGDRVVLEASTPGARKLLVQHGRRGLLRGILLMVVVETMVSLLGLCVGLSPGIALVGSLVAACLLGLSLWMWWR